MDQMIQLDERQSMRVQIMAVGSHAARDDDFDHRHPAPSSRCGEDEIQR